MTFDCQMFAYHLYMTFHFFLYRDGTVFLLSMSNDCYISLHSMQR